MNGTALPFGRLLRQMPLARSLALPLLTIGRPAGGADDGVLFLFYHHLPRRDRARFARQLTRLRDLAEFVGVTDALRLLAGGGPDGRVGGRFVCLTFDDGHRDAYEHAVPILAERGVPAAFFVVPGWIDAGRPDTVTWADCRALTAGGMEVGSHSMQHDRFSALADEAAAADLALSRARIEAEIRRPCLHFACPWGQPTRDFRAEREPALARAAGYQSFFTTIPRRAAAATDPWSLPRVRMEPGWGMAELRYAFQR
ncbi:polysaccharide deacetylase family protein [Roseomonas elaeocarpi]|uniref:Chitooligosaccharide deacetylase n=1 Tax=Roseomonas elaeocarpi TaxID=907779 RepID=A0ABV6JLP3_9PROT